MREIKFRAFVDGKMYPVTNLDYIQDGSGIIAHIHVKGINQEIPSGQFELMQYTGLKDKNGKEIYEGDILTFPKDSVEDYIVHAVIKYGVGEFDGGVYKYPGFYLESTGDDVNCKNGDIMEPYEITNLIKDTKWYDYEVVGNIFEGTNTG